MTPPSITFLSLFFFGIATLFTPGPNNLMLMTSGLHVGIKDSLKPIWGVALGFAFLVLCVGLGLGVVLSAYPVLTSFLRYAGSAYILYLAVRIAFAPPPSVLSSTQQTSGKFWPVVAFQWINPKGWMMALGVTSSFASVAAYPLNAVLVAGLLGVIGVASSLLWVWIGCLMQRAVRTPRLFRFFNILMAVLLLVSLYPVLTAR